MLWPPCTGIIWPLESMPVWLRYFSYCLPMTYAAEAMRCILARGENSVCRLTYPPSHTSGSPSRMGADVHARLARIFNEHWLGLAPDGHLSCCADAQEILRCMHSCSWIISLWKFSFHISEPLTEFSKTDVLELRILWVFPMWWLILKPKFIKCWLVTTSPPLALNILALHWNQTSCVCMDLSLCEAWGGNKICPVLHQEFRIVNTQYLTPVSKP